MNITEIRSRYLKFFEDRGHFVIPSASLVPHNDPTTLFTGSGMQPLIQNLLGKEHPLGSRLTNSQKCLRTEDIEEVGDNRHTTFFEMLGNWSLGDYYKKEQLSWFFEFLTEEIGLDPNNLYVTVFAGDDKLNLPRDIESANIWKELFGKKGIDARDIVIGSKEDGARLGMQGGRIFYYDATKNWWSRAGVPENMPVGEPGGPDSEVFYDFGSKNSPRAVRHDPKFGSECHPNCDCGRFLEIGNSVFMEYVKNSSTPSIGSTGSQQAGSEQANSGRGSFSTLPRRNVDFGGGLERIAAASEDNPDIFSVDVFSDIIGLLIHFSKKEYTDSRYTRSFRIIADHIRAATFILADGVKPGNAERGYVLRRLIRRAAEHTLKLSVGDKDKEDSMLVRAAILTIEKYKGAYPELDGEEVYRMITDAIWNEEKQFARALDRGMREFERVAATGHIEAAEAYMLFTTHGFPFEMTMELAKERGIDVDEMGFRREMKKHQQISRAGVAQKFKGGLADTSEKTTRLHTAHHLLLKALQIVLGGHVKQRGSNITQERLRIDFSHGEKMTKEQIAEVEKIVNEKIREGIPVVRTEMSREEAEKLGAEREFGAKYPERVSVYSVGPLDSAFSIEFCGGPHVINTAEVGKSGTFKIQKEEAVAAGIRRIKATLN